MKKIGFRLTNILLIATLIIFVSCVKRDFKIVAKAELGTVTEILATSAKASGNLVDLGNGVSDYGHCWGLIAAPTIQNSKTSFGNAEKTETFISNLQNLEPGKTYHIRAYVTSGKEQVYGNDIQFTTQNGQAVLATNNVTNITINTASSGGSITGDGGAQITARGVCWSTTQNPTIANYKTVDGLGSGTFSSNITGLQIGQIYYIRAYATNSINTTYGNQLSFTTKNGAIVLSSAGINQITASGALSGGTITDDGGAGIVARGVCWNTSQNPTIANNKTVDGDGIGSYISTLKNLKNNTSYFIRAYASNIVGTTYGNEIFFTTSPITGLTVGQSFQGGIIAYIFQPGDPGYDGEMQHGLIIASNNQGSSIWGISNIITGASESGIGTGNTNTNKIVSILGQGNYAAKLCYDLNLGGYNDWFLPSLDELAKLYYNQAVFGGLSWYIWSSTECGTDCAIGYGTSPWYSFKSSVCAVRAIRYF